MSTTVYAQTVFLLSISFTIWGENIAFHKFHWFDNEKKVEKSVYSWLGLIVTGVLMLSLLVRALCARQHFMVNLFFVVADSAFLVAISRMLALHAEIGYPIIAGAAVLLLIAAQFQAARDFYLRINGGAEEAKKKAAEAEARKKAEEVEAKKKAEEEAHNNGD